MTIDWTSLVGNGSVQRFARSLRVALHDKLCEENGPVLFCYDTPVVARMVLGFEQFQDEGRPKVDPRNLLVRSLLSSGYLGRVTLLRPHALELHQVLARKESFLGVGARAAYRNRLKQFLDSRGVADAFAELVEGTINKNDAECVQHFLSLMQRIAPTSFVSIELANGSWQQRLTRLHKMGILRFEGDSTELRRVLPGPLVWQFKERLESGIKNFDKYRVLPILRDATALSILHDMIGRYEKGESVPQVRFFTEAIYLREAWEKNPDMVRLLSYSEANLGAKLGSDELFVGREVNYFILRASFEALRFPEVDVRAEPTVSLAELQEVSEELESVTNKASSEVENYLSSRRLGPRLLVEHLQDFSSLAFLNSIWLSYEPPALVRELVQGLEEVWKFGQEEEIEEALQQRIRREAEDIQSALRATVREVDLWFETLDNVRDRVERVIQKSVIRCEVPPSPERDLGIARWGLDLSPEGEAKFKNFARPLLSQDDQEWHRGCFDLTTAILDVGDDIERCVVICAILWWLNGFKTLAQTIERAEAELQKKEQSLPMGLSIMRAASLLQNNSYDVRTKEAMIGQQVSLLEALPEAERSRYCVGISYLYYRAWSSETHDKKEEVTTVNRVFLDRWISESFLWAKKAEDLLPRDSLLWAFAVNICAYVGVAAEMEDEKTDRYIRLLGDLEKRYNLWNYRFADTLSYHYLLLAERKHRNRGDAKEVCRLLKASADYLADARNCFADPAIPAHRNQLIQLRSKVGCTDVEIPDL